MLNSEFVSREKQDKLQQYIDLLIKWNKKINFPRHQEKNIHIDLKQFHNAPETLHNGL